MERNRYKVEFETWRTIKLGYFDKLPDLEDTCEKVRRSEIVLAETEEKAQRKVDNMYSHKIYITKTTQIAQKERTL